MTASTRKEAKEHGDKYYFTGVSCKHGHLTNRFTSCLSCVECRRLQSKGWYSDKDRSRKKTAKWRSANPEKQLANDRNWRASNPEKVKEIQTRWNKLNHSKSKKKNRDWYARNVEEQRKRCSDWGKANPEARKATVHRRRARIYGAGGSHTKHDVQEIYKAQKGKCAYCRIKVGKKYHVDHIMPLVAGGSNDKTNIQITCPPCNQFKNARHPIEFAQSRGLLL